MASSVRYNYLPPTALETSNNTIIDDCYMSKTSQLAKPRKRQRTEQHPSHSKRQKLCYHSGPYPPEFWDDLSKIWLTKYALKELDRRNAKPLLQSLYQQTYRPVTRYFLTRAKKLHKPTQSASDFLHSCAPETLKDIKLFARHGGPDLPDLKGVYVVRYLTSSTRADAI
jgi:hypothetical protein